MPFPDFFADAPAITVRDPLAAFLGAPSDGLIHYGFEDAVRLAGHSCPTVAGAWLMTLRALEALWPGEVPERGAVEVLLPDAQDEGVTGVMAAVAGLVTGAAGPGGFKGIAGRFGRDNLLRFETPVGAEMGFRRRDSGREVVAHYHPERAPAQPEMRVRLQRLLSGEGSEDDARTFAALWQNRVRRILVELGDDPDLVRIVERA